MIGTQRRLRDPARRRRPGHRPRLHRAVRPRPRGAGFDRVLIGYGSGWPEGRQVAAHVADAHRAARPARRPPARLRRADAGRPRRSPPSTSSTAAGWRVHIITGGNDAEQRRDGDYLDNDERYARTDEYLDDPAPGRGTSPSPFDHEGGYYRFEGCAPQVLPVPGPAPPAVLRRRVRGGVPGRRQARRHLRALGRAARGDRRADRGGAGGGRGRRAGRAPRISVSFRPILAPTEELAWERAARHPRHASTSEARRCRADRSARCPAPTAERRLAAAARGRREGRPARPRAVDRRPPRRPAAAATPPRSSAPPRPVAAGAPRLRRHRRRPRVLIRGFDPLDDAVDYGALPAPARPPGAGAPPWPLDWPPVGDTR